MLWFLSCYDELGIMVSQLERVKPLSHSLMVMRAAGKMRHSLLSREAKVRLIEELRQVMDRLQGAALGTFLLGLGYVEFHAWDGELESLLPDGIGRVDGAAQLDWAAVSFARGEEALLLLPADTLQWAFAINHCAYVGSVANIEGVKTEKYVAILQRLSTFPGVWHYRFADTLAWSKYTAARRLWDAATNRSDVQGEVCGLLASATRLLAQARPDYGDPEMPSHDEAVAELDRRAACGIEDASRRQVGAR
jgi:hypothetical protein